jgi:hypothetical protein
MATFITVPLVMSVQYTVAESTAMPYGSAWPEASVTGWHIAPAQAPPWQSCPQVPQSLGAVLVSTHALEQQAWPLGQPVPQPPLELLLDALVDAPLELLLDALVDAPPEPLLDALVDAPPEPLLDVPPAWPPSCW